MSLFLNDRLLRDFATEDFASQRPFPWYSFQDVLRPEAFEALYREFPSLELFERHNGITRAYGQRPHNRYYLAYERSIYNDREAGSEGVVALGDLPVVWQQFMLEVQGNSEYAAFARRMLGVDDFVVRFAWHVGVNGSEVSPHRDSHTKLGTHIFYFNTSEDWQPEWGGSILVLDGKKVPQDNPDLSDFESVRGCDIRDNRSFLFKNTENAWHGVEKLTCPEGRYRRLFNVVFEPVRQNQAREEKLRDGAKGWRRLLSRA
ncbi:2OG-Fe(II) oxygenase [Pseudomonas sp. ZM23]|uniref:2OG-Fe(II) oxygenase n=1 Tax=Pseudomonas triclosanedens TaxID=2961893 RepID=A0ABY6ZUZ0_9PSED|nr:2OG-Fe(II) oxygenase [Pseudomonas triclosanedens]MCP8467246.1 2OG-Fe(II) oxygenase [Pseudomonas triclosanedens]MCP8472573.1 2OG-Fe(II) oxygenase [Pseudomonas triclosanedens]MCP8478634.1 2OG-Fe(II) oxygenase [Pseudomonas triclosanedens]WAI47808.1 2OG-Fe(II) oxygenase [Pseudomonas triclosanedens]